jgi:hypothetical protein
MSTAASLARLFYSDLLQSFLGVRMGRVDPWVDPNRLQSGSGRGGIRQDSKFFDPAGLTQKVIHGGSGQTFPHMDCPWVDPWRGQVSTWTGFRWNWLLIWVQRLKHRSWDTQECGHVDSTWKSSPVLPPPLGLPLYWYLFRIAQTPFISVDSIPFFHPSQYGLPI